jgi:hypothetical protein
MLYSVELQGLFVLPHLGCSTQRTEKRTSGRGKYSG